MTTTCSDNLATMEFELAWEHDGVRHRDRRYARRVNFWRDLLPEKIMDAVMHRRAGESVALDFAPKEIVRPRDERRVHRVPASRVADRFGTHPVGTPRYGRFYPAGILGGLTGVFKESVTPFRVVDRDDAGIVADFNHPLAGKPLKVSTVIHEVRPKFEEHGGTCVDWAETLVDGPGVQARANGRATDFFADRPFDRGDENDDGGFYAQPRMVHHLDAAARSVVAELYGHLLRPEMAVLDLMSSWTSHLPENLSPAAVTGLGMNAEELDANPRLTDSVVHDLNRTPELPFGEGRFDAAICTASVEYLIQPLSVFAEVARVVRPGGVFAVSFSDRWFPPKAIRIWSEIHEFERLGLVLEYFRDSGRFTDLETFSLRGLPRPEDDKYYPQRIDADPVFAVWGRVAENV